MKLKQDDVTLICRLVVDHGLNTGYVAERYDISRCRVQQLAKEYRETEEILQLQTPGRRTNAEYPTDLVERILELYEFHEQGAAAIAHMLRQCDGLSTDNNRVHQILQEYETVTENPRKQGRRRPWIRWERDYSLVTVHMDWFHNSRNQWCLAVEDDAARKILGMIEAFGRSGEKTVRLLNEVRAKTAGYGVILEVITDHGSEFYASRRDQDGNADHAFERYLTENNIQQTLCAVGRPQSNGKIERFFQTYVKQRWRFESLEGSLEYYNNHRSHQSLRYDELETPTEVFDRLLPTTADAASLAVADGGEHDTK